MALHVLNYEIKIKLRSAFIVQKMKRNDFPAMIL